MIATPSFQCILIIFQVSHDELLERNVDNVHLVRTKSKAFVRRDLMIIIDLSVLIERAQLSLKTTFSPQIILMHNLTIHFLYDQR